jgi:uncharacterized protein YpbB
VEQKAFILRYISQSFNWEKLAETFRINEEDYEHRQIPDKGHAYIWAKNITKNILQQQEVSTKFGKQLEQLLQVAEQDGYINLQQRTAAACDYFIQLLDKTLASIQEHVDEMKGKLKVKKYIRELRELQAIVQRKKKQLQHVLHIVNGLMKGADVDDLLQMTEEPTAEPAEIKAEKPQKEAKQKAQKGDSHRMSLQLFRDNKTIAEIAALRELTYGTIENHLITFIATGEIGVEEIVPTQKLDQIINTIREAGPSSLTAVKERLGNDVSFGEIRAVFRHLEKMQEAGPE